MVFHLEVQPYKWCYKVLTTFIKVSINKSSQLKWVIKKQKILIFFRISRFKLNEIVFCQEYIPKIVVLVCGVKCANPQDNLRVCQNTTRIDFICERVYMYLRKSFRDNNLVLFDKAKSFITIGSFLVRESWRYYIITETLQYKETKLCMWLVTIELADFRGKF